MTCLDCQQMQRDDWFIRNYAEFKDTQRNGGCTFFLTLTYAEVPRFKSAYLAKASNDADNTLYECDLDTPCFSLEHLQTFTRTLRQYCRRRYGKSFKLRYQIFPEYGSKTKRPHYHCLFYTSHFVSPKSFYTLVDGYENDTKRKKAGYRWDYRKPYFKTRHHDGAVQRGAWKHGWVLVSKPSKGGMTVKNFKSLLYCCKYATKDIAFYGKEDIQHYLHSIKDKTVYTNKEERDRLLSEFSRISARHRQSPCLGFNWLSCKFALQYDDIIKHGFEIDYSDGNKRYQLPEYYKRKILYQYKKINDRVVWLYKPESLKYHKAYFQNSVNRTVMHLSDCIRLDCIDRFTAIDHNGVKWYKTDISNFFRQFLCKHSLLDLARFKIAYSGRNYNIDEYFHKTEALELPIDWLLLTAQEHYIQSLNNLKTKDVGFSLLKSQYGEHYLDSTYDSLPQFKDFSTFLQLADKISSFLKGEELRYNDYLSNFCDNFTDSLHPYDMPVSYNEFI